MNLLTLLTIGIAFFGFYDNSEAKALDTSNTVKIERQKLVKFPEDVDQHKDDSESDKNDEAKRILEEIEKINQALGYVKKYPEARVPPVLDSSQYLFPKPSYHPFHVQNHEASGSNGETILLPSIRTFNNGQLNLLNIASHDIRAKSLVYQDPYHTEINLKSSKNKESQFTGYVIQLNQPMLKTKKRKQKFQYYYRPNQVHVAAPKSYAEKQQLPTHFLIPVHLYKMNKKEYIEEFAPQEYHIKGYKIVGDIDHFYGKAKSQNNLNKATLTPKYHLLFLPRELVLNDNSTFKRKSAHPKNSANSLSGSREEKLANRPVRLQVTANANPVSGPNATVSSQIIRKRIIPKPLRDKETNIGSVATHQLPGGGTATASTTIHITPPPIALNTNLNGNNLVSNSNNKNKLSLGNRPLTTLSSGVGLNSIFNNTFNSNQNDMKSNTSNVIKNAFQNIFKLPFRQDTTTTTDVPHLESVSLTIPTKTFFATQSILPQSFYTPENTPNGNDYKWDDEDSASETEEEANTPDQVEKKIFGYHHQQTQDTQKEAIKQGGIIIQKLKVRKGGIAIAGPGGVATAGSGGTAIVGPGGYALTHPRSLTIAGPGAKVIAIPGDVDLKDALQRTNIKTREYPREGKIVATGPTVYYAPDFGTETGI